MPSSSTNAIAKHRDQAPEPSRPPRVADHVLLHRIGRGAYGDVWLGRTMTGALRAVKVVYRYRFGDDRPYERELTGITKFEPISRANAGLVDVLQVGRDDAAACFYYVMELADDARSGATIDPACYVPHTLSEDLRQRSRLPYAECLQLGLTLCLALAHLHRHGLLHRDVKPSNIIFVGGHPKLADIGLVADAAEARTYVGTEGFIPPDGPNSPQADLYSLGKVLYEVSMGKDRQEFPEPFANLAIHPEAEELLELNAVILKACANDRTERYQTAEEMHLDLALLQSGRSVKRKRTLERRLAWATKAGLLAALLAIIASIGFQLQHRQSRELERLARAEALQRSRAQAALRLADQQLVRLEMQRAEEQFAADRPALALAQLAHALREHPGHPLLAVRLLSALSFRQFLRPGIPPILLDGPIQEARLSPHGSTLAVAARHSIRLYYGDTGRPSGPPLQHPADLAAFAFAAQEKELVTLTRDDQLRIWALDRDQPTISRTLPFTPASFETSTDGERLLLLDSNGTGQLWDLNLRRPLDLSLSTPTPILLARLSPDGRILASASTNHSVQLWNLDPPQPRPSQIRHQRLILSLAFSPDGRRLVTTGADSSARIWDVASGAACSPPLLHRDWIYMASFSPDGRQVVTAGADASARRWSAETGAPLGPALPHEGPVRFAEFSPDGRMLVTQTANQMLRLWDATSGQPRTDPLPLPDKILSVHFSSNSQRLVVTSKDQRVRLFEAFPAAPAWSELPHANVVLSASFNADGSRLVTASRDGTAKIWPAANLPQASPIPLPHLLAVNSAEFSPNGRYLVTASDDRTARLWDAATGRPLHTLAGHTDVLNDAQFDAASRRVVTASRDHTARLWSVPDGQPLGPPLAHPHDVIYAEFSPDGTSLATACRDGSACLWAIGPPAVLRATLRHREAVYEIHWNPEGNRVVTASEDQTAQVWDSVTGRPVTPPLRHAGGVGMARFSPDGRLVLTAAGDNTARLWDAASGQPLAEPMRHDGPVESARFSPDGARVVTSSRDGTARIWDTANGGALSEPLRHGDTIYTARFSPDGRAVVTAGRDNQARVWTLPDSMAGSWLPDLAEAIAGQRFTPARVLIPGDEAVWWRLRAEATAGRDTTNAATKWLRWFFFRPATGSGVR